MRWSNIDVWLSIIGFASLSGCSSNGSVDNNGVRAEQAVEKPGSTGLSTSIGGQDGVGTGTGTTQPAQPKPVVGPSRHVHWSALAGEESTIAIQTKPFADCKLHDSADEKPDRTMSLRADDHGIIRFNGRLDSVKSSQLTLTCTTSDGTTEVQDIVVESTADPTVVNHASDVIGKRQVIELPALQGDDPVKLSDEEIEARGYPRRPKDDVQYAHWLKTVSRPLTIISSQSAVPGQSTVPSQSKHRSLSTDIKNNILDPYGNWSGNVAINYAVYDQVYGWWTVPPLYWGNQLTDWISMWVGLDGAYDRQLVQAGVRQTLYCTNTCWYSNIVWYEMLPGPEMDIPLTVSWGDEVSVSVSATDVNHHLNCNAGYVFFAITNETKNVIYNRLDYPPDGGKLPCDPAVSSAEYILEFSAEWGEQRDGQYHHIDIANFGSTKMNGQSHMTNGTYQWIYQGGYNLYDLYPGGKQLDHSWMNGNQLEIDWLQFAYPPGWG